MFILDRICQRKKFNSFDNIWFYNISFKTYNISFLMLTRNMMEHPFIKGLIN